MESTSQGIYEGFVNYVNALQSCITEQIPAVLEKASRLPSEAEDAQSSFQSEIDGLDFLKKGQAVLAIAFNMRQLSKIPTFIKTTAQGF
jgi:hypothetical protein